MNGLESKDIFISMVNYVTFSVCLVDKHMPLAVGGVGNAV